MLKIAVLEDNPAIYEFMTVALEMAGHQVQVYTHAAALLATLLPEEGLPLQPPYDLITVDLSLPGDLSGYEFIHRIRHRYTANQLPMIIISGVAPSFFGPLQDRFPHIPILQKPFQMKRLLQLLEEMKQGVDQAKQLES